MFVTKNGMILARIGARLPTRRATGTGLNVKMAAETFYTVKKKSRQPGIFQRILVGCPALAAPKLQVEYDQQSHSQNQRGGDNGNQGHHGHPPQGRAG